MLVTIDHLPLRVRNPDLRAEVYAPDGTLDREGVRRLFAEGRRRPPTDAVVDELVAMFTLWPADVPGVYWNSDLESQVRGIAVRYDGSGRTHRDPWSLARAGGEALDLAVSSYGTADSLDQVLAHFADFVADPVRQYVIQIGVVSKGDQPAEGGWRWHRNGPYIGRRNPQCEYLADEPHIEAVLSFGIHEVRLPDHTPPDVAPPGTAPTPSSAGAAER
jgi:hypothetical protein